MAQKAPRERRARSGANGARLAGGDKSAPYKENKISAGLFRCKRTLAPHLNGGMSVRER